MSRPPVGVTGPDRGGRALWLFTRWAVRLAGGRAVRVTPSRPAGPSRFAAWVVAGGTDIDPALYGQENLHSPRLDPPRDRLESDIVRRALDGGVPLLGICRGMQLLNVTLGGTLHQDAAAAHDGFRPTSGLYRKVVLRRPIRIMKEGFLSQIWGTGRKEYRVNSLHRQAVADLGRGLEVVAADEYGMTQAVEPVEKSAFTLGVQWHPELMPRSSAQMAIFKALLTAAAG